MGRIAQIYRGVRSRWRNLWYRLLGVQLEGYAWLQAVEMAGDLKRIRIGKDAAIDRGVVLLVTCSSGGITIGSRTYINRYTMIDAAEQVTIGSGTMIGPFCYITDHDHSRGDDGGAASGELVCRPTTIGERCWIGAHVTILKGVSLGDGCTIGAGSVVTKSIPPGAVAMGNPARVRE